MFPYKFVMEALGLGNTEEYAIFVLPKIYFFCFLGAHTFIYTPIYLSRPWKLFTFLCHFYNLYWDSQFIEKQVRFTTVSFNGFSHQICIILIISIFHVFDSVKRCEFCMPLLWLILVPCNYNASSFNIIVYTILELFWKAMFACPATWYQM